MRRHRRFAPAGVGLALLAAAVATLLQACRPEERAESASRVIVLGLDGVDPDVVETLIGEGKLPNFERLRDGGASGRLYSPPPLLSPIIWTTVATGREPTDHGIAHFTATDPETGEVHPVPRTLRRTKALWNIFSDHGREVGVVGWWATWPAEPVAGAIVSDRAGYHFLMAGESAGEPPPEGVVHPADSAAELLAFVRSPEEVGLAELQPFVDVTAESLAGPFRFDDDLSHFRWALAAATGYRDLGLHLWRQERPGLLMVYVEGVDTTSHLFGHLYRQRDLAGELARQQAIYGRAVEEMYRLADRIVGDYLAAMDEETTLVVLSDHGFKLGELHDDPSKARDLRRVSEAYHLPEGILFFFGKGVVPGARLERPRTLDVAPSVLAMAGLPVSEEMPGRVLAEGFRPSRPVARVATFEEVGETGDTAPGEVAAVPGDAAALERLRSLGYLGSSSSGNDRNLASMLLQDQRWEEAETAFRSLAGQEPDDPVLRMSLGVALAGLGRTDEALAELDRALVLDPLLVPALHNRGLVRERRGEREAAVADFRTALGYDPEYEPSRRALGRLGAPALPPPANEAERRAATLLREAVERVRRGDYDGAEELVAQAGELTPEAAVVYQYRANVAYLKGDRAAAVAALERGLELDPGNALLETNLRRLKSRGEEP